MMETIGRSHDIMVEGLFCVCSRNFYVFAFSSICINIRRGLFNFSTKILFLMTA